MDYPETDQRIYDLHETYHDGAVVDCRQCRKIIGIVDDAVELARSTTPLTDDTLLTDESSNTLDALAWAVLNPPPEKRRRYLG